ncbi:conserved hypothetical protein [Coccidioides posadasii str. Silveira]|uniref:Uncharacterized protein n=1 Tax=Coccidioides posadasii (strain RMSCC 757 / Silveira) TaxID=443226 RepID=E9D4E5_COCPS|nr:conserved hypothetical protein [Coccidioides posadasii str. Silveira]
MASVSKLRRVLITGTLSVAIASGALYGASLKMKQESKRRRWRSRFGRLKREKGGKTELALAVVKAAAWNVDLGVRRVIAVIVLIYAHRQNLATSDECTRELRGRIADQTVTREARKISPGLSTLTGHQQYLITGRRSIKDWFEPVPPFRHQSSLMGSSGNSKERIHTHLRRSQ